MTRALILVDIQNDFMPGGALPVPEGHQVVPIANQLQQTFEHVFATQDWHPDGHGSFAEMHNAEIGTVGELGGLPQIMWPVHCVQETEGAAFVSGLLLDGVKVVQKGTDPTIDSYSGFFDNDHRKKTELDALLKSANIDEVFVMGVATDYCVLYTALDAVELGYKTHLVLDGCRGVNLNPEDVEMAIQTMKDHGIEITESSKVVA